MLKWVLERVNGGGSAEETPIGLIPSADALDLSGLELTDDDLDSLLDVDTSEWLAELELIREHYDAIGERLPQEMRTQLDQLAERLGA